MPLTETDWNRTAYGPDGDEIIRKEAERNHAVQHETETPCLFTNNDFRCLDEVKECVGCGRRGRNLSLNPWKLCRQCTDRIAEIKQ